MTTSQGEIISRIRDTGYNGPTDQEFDPWITAPMCGHKALDEEIDADGWCINCSAWSAFKKNLLFNVAAACVVLGSAIVVAYLIANKP
jgi:hypothetical protein